MSAEERILDKANAKAKANLELDEVKFWMRKWGLIVTMYPHIAKAMMIVPLQGEFALMQADIDRLKAEVDTLKTRLHKAGLLVKEIDERTRPKAAQPQRR